MRRDLLTIIAGRSIWARILSAALVLGALILESAAAQFTLERVVLVSRHGVRAPTDSRELNDYTKSRTWPTWPVKDACLTPHGKLLASRMGSFYRRELTARGLFPANRRPTAKEVYVFADISQRTVETGAGLIEGFFACKGAACPPVACLTCGPAGPSQECKPSTKDPLFHPVSREGSCTIDPTRAREEPRGPLEKAQKQPGYHDTVRKLQDVLDCCRPPLCPTKDDCTLNDLHNKIVDDSKDGGVSLNGPIAIGSTASEVFLLEYAQGMPSDQVAWGHGSTAEHVIKLMLLHGVQFDLLQRTEYLAKRQGSALVDQVLETLRQTARGTSDPVRPVPREAKLVIYVGHDTNLANIGGMLKFNWQLGRYEQNETPPAGAMMFELLRNAAGKHFVRVSYVSQNLDQMRQSTILRLPRRSGEDRKATPDLARIAIDKYCARTVDSACPFDEFYENAKATLHLACVRPKPN